MHEYTHTCYWQDDETCVCGKDDVDKYTHTYVDGKDKGDVPEYTYTFEGQYTTKKPVHTDAMFFNGNQHFQYI